MDLKAAAWLVENYRKVPTSLAFALGSVGGVALAATVAYRKDVDSILVNALVVCLAGLTFVAAIVLVARLFEGMSIGGSIAVSGLLAPRRARKLEAFYKERFAAAASYEQKRMATALRSKSRAFELPENFKSEMAALVADGIFTIGDTGPHGITFHWVPPAYDYLQRNPQIWQGWRSR